MKETLKSKPFRTVKNHFELYLNGYGIDIGAGDDILEVEEGRVDAWDLEHGDAQYMVGVNDNTYDFVYSSHCLEHMKDVEESLKNWFRILKPYGHLYFTVPEYVLYEKLRFPSIYNPDHKNSFSYYITRQKTKRLNHYHVNDMITIIEKLNCTFVLCDLEDKNFDYNIGPDVDQTRLDAQAQLLFVARKK
jgi:ubiquinone/menaquinone biosynthesis C-methylase UbiE